MIVCPEKVFRDANGNPHNGFYLDDNLKSNIDSYLIPAVAKKWDACQLFTGMEGCTYEVVTIQTPSGIKRLCDLKSTDTLYALDIENDKKVEAPFFRKDTGIKEVFELKTASGNVTQATADHTFFVRRNGKIVEVALKDIVVGDELLCT